MTNPADKHVCDLIEKLVKSASDYTCVEEDRQTYINQIAQLRASMNPVIIQKSE